MDPGKRNELVDAYYAAIDEETFDDLGRVFAADVEYLYPGEPTMHGIDAVLSFFEERREHSNSTHEVYRRLADEEVTVCEGTITADRTDGSEFDAGFVGVFEFDGEAKAIDRVGVYVRR